MKHLKAAAVAFLLAFAVPACHSGATSEAPAAAAREYSCPMGHATSDKPGKCPKCGMEMTEKK